MEREGVPAAFARCRPNGRLRQFGVVKLEARFVVQVLARLADFP